VTGSFHHCTTVIEFLIFSLYRSVSSPSLLIVLSTIARPLLSSMEHKVAETKKHIQGHNNENTEEFVYALVEAAI
jgi:hypothetical protein